MWLCRKCHLDVDLSLLDVAKNKYRPDDTNGQSTPDYRTGPANPQQHDEAAAEDADKQAVASGGIKTKHAMSGGTSGHFIFPETHSGNGRKNSDEENGRWPRPRHP